MNNKHFADGPLSLPWIKKMINKFKKIYNSTAKK